MSNDGDNNLSRDSSSSNDSEGNKSFVKKVKSRVSGFIPSSLTKWFAAKQSPKVRQRDDCDDEDDEVYRLQPPLKRAKFPIEARDLEINFSSTPIHSGPHLNSFGTAKAFEEPIAGTSRANVQKLLMPSISTNHFNVTVDVHNGDKDSDSGESTSGYSSMPRIGSKEQVSEITDKHNTTRNKPNSRSLFSTTATNERSLFSEVTSTKLNTSLSTRQPSFNVSTIGSPNFMDRTLSTKRIVSSPFYSGRTTYGGAAAYSRNSSKKTPEKASSLRNFVRPKPTTTTLETNLPLSKTARRILNTLEQYTSPSEDVRKIPNPSTRRPGGLISKYTGANPYLIKDLKVASNKELQVPTMTDLLKMKLKERLQDSTVSVREIATKSKSALNTQEYHLRTTEKESRPRPSNKIKTKISSVRQKSAVADVSIVDEVTLPDVQLPISKLPDFDFIVPQPPQKPMITEPVKEKKSATTKKTSSSNKYPISEKKDLDKHLEFKFSKPLVISENKPIKAINNFKFSEPVSKKSLKGSEKINFKSFETTSKPPKKRTLKSFEEKKEDSKENSEGSWECSLCMARNLQEKKKCVACETPRLTKISEKLTQSPKTSIASPAGFGDKFKLSKDQWECKTCLLRNDETKDRCVACESLRVPAPVTEKSPPSKGFGNQFKMSADKWECNVCMIRNENNVDKCAACTTPRILAKPVEVEKSGFGNKFKKPTGTWECNACFVVNKLENTKCIACETPKPGGWMSKGMGDLLKKKENEWECNSCLVRNSSDKTKCVCCESLKPGTTAPIINVPVTVEDSLPKFSFGIDKAQLNGNGFAVELKENKSEIAAPAPSSIFGDSAKASQKAAPPTFVFGVKPINNTKPVIPEKPQVNEVKPVESKTTKDFIFGIPTNLSPKVTKVTQPEPPLPKKVETKATSALNGVIKNVEPMIKTTEPPQFSFGATAAVVAKNSPNLFSFGTKPPASATLVAEQTEKKTSLPSPVFSLGDKQPSTTVSSLLNFAAPSQSTPTFGSTNPPAFGAPSTNPPSFGTPKANPPPTFGTSIASSSPFSTTSTPAPAFGSSLFGSATSEVSAPVFGASTQPIQNRIFNFGNAASSATPKTGFNFGTNVSNPPTGALSFGPTNQMNLQNSTAGGFNFGAVTPTPAFNADIKPSLNFTPGAVSSAIPKTGFNFGANAPNPPSGAFSFGSTNQMNAQNSTAGGFNFGAVAPTPAFNADIKPSFNFTAGAAPSAFTAQAQTGESSSKPRVIKRALRRTQR